MKTLIVAAIVFVGAQAVGQGLNYPAVKRQGVVRLDPATDVQAIEDTAMTFFRQLAFYVENYPSPKVMSSPKEILGDRGFSESEAEELIAVARRLNSFEVNDAAIGDFRQSRRQLCADLRAASKVEDAIKALENDDELARAANRLSGAKVLAELKPSTRVNTIRALKEFRKDVTVSSIEWTRLSPEMVAAHKTQACDMGR